jgi:bifunctional non-homologous end joining protein LigD
MSLNEYRRKRDFEQTGEPAGTPASRAGASYFIQKHDASRLHYDFRLELGGVLKSWAVPKGPSLDPGVKSLAVHVEDHPLEYGTFEGVIPQGQYGGGTVMLWDRGTWQPEGNAVKSYKIGKLVFRLDGDRLKGRWALIRMGGKAGADGKNWLLKKLDDDEARPAGEYDILARNTTSVVSGRTMNQIATGAMSAANPHATSRRTRKASTTERPDSKTQRPAARRSVDPSVLYGAARSAMPAAIAPELPQLVDEAPPGDEWLYELKLDGYRMICFLNKGKVRLRTRGGNDWTHRFPTIARAVAELRLESAILDGEIVALKPDGTSHFQSLQNMLKHGNDKQIVFFVFDLLYYKGHDLRQVSLLERKQFLSELVGKKQAGVIRYNDHISGRGGQVFARACGHGLEGIVAKRADSHYIQGRTTDWVKVKCLKRQEFVIGGWTEPGGGRESLGALLVGYYRTPSELVYCGRVGTGFTQQSLHDVHKQLASIEQTRSPFSQAPSGVAARGLIHWAQPKVVAEVAFGAWTEDGILRHASFQGIREDKNPKQITRELAVATPDAGPHKPAKERVEGRNAMASAKAMNGKVRQDQGDEFAGVRLTHPDRILFPDEQITKRDLAAYYTAVSPFMLPHVVGRPLSLVRCPEGSGKPCFFQKHLGATMPRAVRGITIKEKAGNGTSIVIDDLAGLISFVQLGVLEIHPWPCREDQIERPDRLILDIDPAEDLAWSDVVRAAREVKAHLAELGLVSFVRTTGGKGLHVVAPFARRSSWDDLKSLAKAFALALVREQPRLYVAQSSKAKRPGKIFIDYLRNERGATAVASYSTRARPGATVATPISWDELSVSLRPARFTTGTVPDRVREMTEDPWKGFFELRQAITHGMQAQIEKW